MTTVVSETVGAAASPPPATAIEDRSPTSSIDVSSTTTSAERDKDVVTRVAGVDPVRPVGFSTVTVRVVDAVGEVCEVCMWLADTSDERATGLMGVTDLGDAVGMAFVYAEEVRSRFHMSGTPTPLSIAWFDGGGAFVSEVDMEPCLDRPRAACPRYRAEAPYALGIEMFRGELDAIGIGPGSTATVLAETEAPECLV